VVELSFRDATADDVDAVVALVQSAYRGESSRAGWTTEADLLDGQRTDAGLVREIVDAEDRLVLLAFDGDELRGCCELRRLEPAAAYFGMFAVEPRLQGGGFGKAILAEAERQAVERWAARRMQMTVLIQREELLAWYVRRGYRRTGRTEAFPYVDERYGLPRRPDLLLEVLEKDLAA
jgi:ribosomal protein S18 acetylase RimI-like enzyme